jgi:glutamyl-tRNA synthetase
MSVITRFAPSPTGYLHIGGARTALFNYLFSKHHGGKFFLRIEDTDEKRSTQAAIDAILQGLEWLGLKYDSDFILQSKNFARHQEIAQKLLEKNQAYLCYTTAEELNEMRKNAERKKEIFRFKSPWRNKFQSQSTIAKPVVRIKAPIEGEMIINDLVQGKVCVKNSELDDMVILRCDNSPTYMLAVVVDDHDMAVTHIIRGDDHLTNAFRQQLIYQALGWKVPEFAHIPLICGADGAKMSKRHGATSVIEYKEMGYLPQALRNYLLRLGWSRGDAEIISDEQAIQWFNINKIGKSAARFDSAKLNYLNKYYIKQKSAGDLYDLIAAIYGDVYFDQKASLIWKAKILQALQFSKERAVTLKELGSQIYFYREGLVLEFDQETKKTLSQKKSLIVDLKKTLNNLNDWNHAAIKNALEQYAVTQALKIKDFGPLLRLILTFSNASAGGIFDIIEILGKAEAERRIDSVILQI